MNNLFLLSEAQIVIEQWRKHYNTIRPHSALNYRPPSPQTFVPLACHLGSGPIKVLADQMID